MVGRGRPRKKPEERKRTGIYYQKKFIKFILKENGCLRLGIKYQPENFLITIGGYERNKFFGIKVMRYFFNVEEKNVLKRGRPCINKYTYTFLSREENLFEMIKYFENKRGYYIKQVRKIGGLIR